MEDLLPGLAVRDLHAERLLEVDHQFEDVDRIQAHPHLPVEEGPVFLELRGLDLQAGALDDHQLHFFPQGRVAGVHIVRAERLPDSPEDRNHLSCPTVRRRIRVPSGVLSANVSAGNSGLIATSERSNWTSSPSASVYAMRRRAPSASATVSTIFLIRFRKRSSDESRRTSIQPSRDSPPVMVNAFPISSALGSKTIRMRDVTSSFSKSILSSRFSSGR